MYIPHNTKLHPFTVVAIGIRVWGPTRADNVTTAMSSCATAGASVRWVAYSM